MLIVAAGLLLLLSIFHSVVGERWILQRIRDEGVLPELWGSAKATFRTIQGTWHFVSVLWTGLAIELLVVQLRPEQAVRGLLAIFGLIFLTFAILPLVWDAGRHKSWIPFGIISALLFLRAFGMG